MPAFAFASWIFEVSPSLALSVACLFVWDLGPESVGRAIESEKARAWRPQALREATVARVRYMVMCIQLSVVLVFLSSGRCVVGADDCF